MHVAKASQLGHNSSRNQRPGGGTLPRVCPQNANVIQEELQFEEEAWYRRQIGSAKLVTTTGGARHQDKLNTKNIYPTKITAHNQRKRMTTAKVANKHGHPTAMNNKHHPHNLNVMTEDNMHNSEGLIVMTNDNEHKLKDLIVMGALTTDQGIKSTASTYNHQPCDQKIQHRQQVNDAYPRPWLPRKPTETPEHHPVHWPNSKMDRRHSGN